MNPTQPRVKALFEKASGLADAAERRAYLQAACAGDEGARREVESLLAAYDRSGSFLQTPVSITPPRLPLQGSGGHRFGDYELLAEIARGGMGVVYKARQVSLNRVVAVKMILSGQFASGAEVNRFRSEAQAAASLNHRNIVGIYEVGEHEGQHYFSMPFVEGQTLAQLVESGQWRPGDGTEGARLIAKLARAMQHAHDAGVVHRDLKPGNIMVDAEGEPCITDFGLARRVRADAHLTLTGQVLGTPSFMAPEQARGRWGQSSPATDIYSLGAVLYYLLTARPPFVADSPLDALLLVLEAEAVLPRRINPLVPGPLEYICLRCLQKRPEDRYASAGDLAMDLERFLKGDLPSVKPAAIGPRFAAWTKTKPALAARFCTVLLSLGIVTSAYQINRYTSLDRHLGVIAVLLAWLVASSVCQRALQSGRHATLVRFLWSAMDPTALTVILLIVQGFRGPVVLLYPTMIAAAGFWFRVDLVTTTTASSLLGYLVLLVTDTHPRNIPIHWDVLAVVGMIVTGVAVAYLVNRVNALTRFYEPRPAK